MLAEHADSTELRGRLDDVIEPNRGARLKVEDPAYGVPFLSSSEVFSLTPTADYLISNKTVDLNSFIITERDVLIPRSGQVGGLIGRAVLPVPQIVGMAGSEHLIRLRCRDKSDAAYLWAVLASQPGYFAVVGTAFGSSIPSIDRGLVADLHVPWFKGSVQTEIVNTVLRAQSLLAKAITSEGAAIAAVEEAIDGLGT